MALAALAKHQLRLGMQTANTQRNKFTKHTYQSHMFSAACPVSLEELLAVALLIMHMLNPPPPPPHLQINVGRLTQVIVIAYL